MKRPIMNAVVLVLNQDYQPVSICSVQRSVKLVFLEKAELLHEDPNRVLRTVTREYSYPSVIRLRRYIHLPTTRIVFSRINGMSRDKQTLNSSDQKSDFTLTYILPKPRDGTDSCENFIEAGSKGNVEKGNRTPEEAAMPLRTSPYRPVYITFFQNLAGSVQENWKPYLYMN